MLELLSHPWPWYVAGPAIGLVVPALLLLGNRQFGVSSNLRHLCAAFSSGRVEFFRYDWRHVGLWNLTFLAGICAGGVVSALLLDVGDVMISPATREALVRIGVTAFSGLAPSEIFSWSGLATPAGLIAIVGGGLLVGFGTAYAGGCTSGHAISGLAVLDRASLLAVLGFFAGGLACTWVIVPWLF
jgi:hypothetical protein